MERRMRAEAPMRRSVSKKLAYGDLFRQGYTVCLLAFGPHRRALRASGLRYRLRRCPRPSVRCAHPHGSPGGRRRKETLFRKASVPTAHVAGDGIQSAGCGPPTPPMGFLSSLRRMRAEAPMRRATKWFLRTGRCRWSPERSRGPRRCQRRPHRPRSTGWCPGSC